MKKLFAVVLFAAVILGCASEPQFGTPNDLQLALNLLPEIPIGDNKLKFEFLGDTWRAKVNGDNFLAGTIKLERTDQGGTLTLGQTHIHAGTVAKMSGKSVNPLLDRWIPTPAPEIVLEYIAGPPASLSVATGEHAAGGGEAAGAARKDLLDPNKWDTYGREGATAKYMAAQELIEGKERKVLNMEVNFSKPNFRNADANIHLALWRLDLSERKLVQTGSGLRFKALGNGKRWRIDLHTKYAGVDTGYAASFPTKKNKVVEITLPYKNFVYSWGRAGNFNKEQISFIEFRRPWEDRKSATLKIYDFEILP